MLKPSGATPMEKTSAPSSTGLPAPPCRRRRWRNRARCAGLRATGGAAASAGELECSGPGRCRRGGAAERRRLRQPAAEVLVEQRLDLALDLVAELVPVRAEQLDAVVLVGVVRGRDHHADVGRMERVSIAMAGVGMGPSSITSMPTEVKPADERGLDHVARQARVLADHDAVAVAAALEQEAGRLPTFMARSGVMTPLARPRMPSSPEIPATHEAPQR